MAGRHLRATVILWEVTSRHGIRPKHSATRGKENWWKWATPKKTSLFCRSWGEKPLHWNRFGSASVGTRAPKDSAGLITHFQFTQTGLKVNRMDVLGNHVAICILGTEGDYLTGHLGTGMTYVVKLIQVGLMALSANGFPSWSTSFIHAQPTKAKVACIDGTCSSFTSRSGIVHWCIKGNLKCNRVKTVLNILGCSITPGNKKSTVNSRSVSPQLLTALFPRRLQKYGFVSRLKFPLK